MAHSASVCERQYANNSERSYTEVMVRANARSPYRFLLRRDAVLRAIVTLNISQNDFARLCRVSSGFMSQLLSGARHAGPRTRRRILAALPTADFDDVFEEVTADGG